MARFIASCASAMVRLVAVGEKGRRSSRLQAAATRVTVAHRGELQAFQRRIRAANRPVLAGGYTFTTALNGRLDGISGCGTSRDFAPAILFISVGTHTRSGPLLRQHAVCERHSCAPLID